MEKFSSGHQGKKHDICFVRRLGKRENKNKTRASVSSRGSKPQTFEFRFQCHTVEVQRMLGVWYNCMRGA